MRHDDPAKGLAVLARLRGKDEQDDKVQTEKDEIMEAIAIESKEEGSWMDLFRSNGISANKRFYLAVGIQFMQQMSGINIVRPLICNLQDNADKLGYLLCSDPVHDFSQHVTGDEYLDGRPSTALVRACLVRDVVHHRSRRPALAVHLYGCRHVSCPCFGGYRCQSY